MKGKIYSRWERLLIQGKNKKWLWREFNPRPPPHESSALTLSYRALLKILKEIYLKVYILAANSAFFLASTFFNLDKYPAI